MLFHQRRFLVLLLGVLCLLLALGAVLLFRYSGPLVSDGGMPHVQLVLGETQQSPYTLPNGHPVGANYAYTHTSGEREIYSIPSLHGIWQLDEAFSQSVLRLEAGTDCISLLCANGEWKTEPRSVQLYRFPLELAEAEPGTAPAYTEGVEVPLRKSGNYYRIDEPLTDCIYVARTVWENGVLEDGWILLGE